MDRTPKTIAFLILFCGAQVCAGEIGSYRGSLELRNWLIGNKVEMVDSIEWFLSLPDAVPISDSTGLILPDAKYRTVNKDKTRGWVNRVIRRLYVKENGAPGYWVYHIGTTLVFDLIPKTK